MAEPRNRKLAQPFAILDLASDQDHFLAFGVAGFCHGCFRLEQDAEKFRQRTQARLFGSFGSSG
jgi:hypothetical protein